MNRCLAGSLGSVSLLFAISLGAAPLWSQASSTVREGDRVRVRWVETNTERPPRESVGRVFRLHADSLVLLSPHAAAPLYLTASQILHLEVGRLNRGRSAAVGAAGGAVLFGASGLLFAAILTSDNGGIDGEAALVLGGGGALVGAAIGSLIGLAVPDRRWRPAALPPGSQAR